MPLRRLSAVEVREVLRLWPGSEGRRSVTRLNRATARRPSPPNHNRNTSRTSNIGTSRNAIAASRAVNRSGDAHPSQHRTGGPPGGPITGGQVVPSRWRELTSKWSHATGGRQSVAAPRIDRSQPVRNTTACLEHSKITQISRRVREWPFVWSDRSKDGNGADTGRPRGQQNPLSGRLKTIRSCS